MGKLLLFVVFVGSVLLGQASAGSAVRRIQIRSRLVNQRGSSVPNAPVALSGGNSRQEIDRTNSDSNGYFLFRGVRLNVEPLRYEVRIETPGYYRTIWSIEPSKEVRLDLGTIMLQAGEPFMDPPVGLMDDTNPLVATIPSRISQSLAQSSDAPLPARMTSEQAKALVRVALPLGARQRAVTYFLNPEDYYAPGFYSFSVYGPRNPVGSSTVGHFLVNPQNADVWDGVGCKEYNSPELAKLQASLRKQLGLTAARYRELRRPSPFCDLK